MRFHDDDRFVLLRPYNYYPITGLPQAALQHFFVLYAPGIPFTVREFEEAVRQTCQHRRDKRDPHPLAHKMISDGLREGVLSRSALTRVALLLEAG